jgi:GxxExxY protein
MHENEISGKIIGAAIEVHRILGPGLLESVYEEALCHELHLRFKFVRQQSDPIPFTRTKQIISAHLRVLCASAFIGRHRTESQVTPISYIGKKAF